MCTRVGSSSVTTVDTSLGLTHFATSHPIRTFSSRVSPKDLSIERVILLPFLNCGLTDTLLERFVFLFVHVSRTSFLFPSISVSVSSNPHLFQFVYCDSFTSVSSHIPKCLVSLPQLTTTPKRGVGGGRPPEYSRLSLVRV